MLRLQGHVRSYAWGSRSAIPRLLGQPVQADPVAELWFGAHPASPSVLQDDHGPVALDQAIADDPERMLGASVLARFGPSLPYLLKLVAPERPLSLQVHPSVDRAREGFAAEEAAGLGRDDPRRNYRDRNHKPELLYALTRFEALCGFRAPRRAAELMAGIDAPLAKRLHEVLVAEPTYEGIRAAFRSLLEPELRPSEDEVQTVADACRLRLVDGSPSPRADRTVVQLADAYPGDPGAVTSLLLNPVTLEPGDALFVPAGGVHAYLKGLGVEVMANSDNVLRAGLTRKHVDIPELLANVDYVAAPPIRVGPEVFYGATKVYYAPVDDFELSVTTVTSGREHPLPGRGPRVLVCLEGHVTLDSVGDGSLTLGPGEAAFAPADDGPLSARGRGRLVQADVP
ncbi:mannose-6-phosphate isomerase, class I [Actinotalea ferrariae]|uniref:mannose-6-phosphate isomerase, class I n=1 Tax=Actinotalea ferrariae TaxID=1386098 RepID=UPI001C8C7C1C|nr:mannose-6-phosphate isomerase, class I [Actinotalea ferrariae]MBX9243457.1 mannose-6-phosphate isomerase, class I [Actinotalea ferrariae]